EAGQRSRLGTIVADRAADVDGDGISSRGHRSAALLGATDPASIERCRAWGALKHGIQWRAGTGLPQEAAEATTRSEKPAEVPTPVVEAPVGEGPCRAELGGVRPGSRGVCLVHRPASYVARCTGDTVSGGDDEVEGAIGTTGPYPFKDADAADDAPLAE